MWDFSIVAAQAITNITQCESAVMTWVRLYPRASSDVRISTRRISGPQGMPREQRASSGSTTLTPNPTGPMASIEPHACCAKIATDDDHDDMNIMMIIMTGQ